MKKTLFGLFAALLLMTSCASSRSAYKLSGEWNVVNLCGQAIAPSDETPFLGFDLNRDSFVTDVNNKINLAGVAVVIVIINTDIG